jgi:uroporphyrinogen decarboxylase
MGLTRRDQVIAQIQHRETEHIPYTLGDFEGDVAERLDAYYGSPAWRNLLDSALRFIPSCASTVLFMDDKALVQTTDLYGTSWKLNPRPFHMIEPAIKSPSMAGYLFPDLEQVFTPGWKDEPLKAIHSLNDHFLITGFAWGLFERSWTLRGFDNMLMDAAAEPDFYDELVEAISNHQIEILHYLLQLPVDGIMFSDDWGYQKGILLGAGRWRKFIKPRLAKQYALAHAAGKFVLSHACGSIAEILPDLIEIGLDVYESVQPEAKNNSPYELKRKYGQHITFWGGLGSQSTIPLGTPAEIKAEVAHLCREMGMGGGYILSPAKTLQPETSTENAAAVVEAFLQESGVSYH